MSSFLELLGRFELPEVRRCAANLRLPIIQEVGSSNGTSSNIAKERGQTGLSLSGAAGQIRTADLILTKDALCLLSYSSKMATRKGLEPSTSGVTGRRSNQLSYRAIFIEQRLAPSIHLAGAEGFEPSARGFGDRCSTS